MKRILRKWVNQPSTLQQYHKLHGKRVLFDPNEEVIYFTEGDVISQQIDPLALSDGWNEVNKTNPVEQP
jgi:hypothetical protein